MERERENAIIKNKNYFTVRFRSRYKKKKSVIVPKLHDRDIVAVLNGKNINEKKQNPSIFETEWDRYKYLKYLESEHSESTDIDEPVLRINNDYDPKEVKPQNNDGQNQHNKNHKKENKEKDQDYNEEEEQQQHDDDDNTLF